MSTSAKRRIAVLAREIDSALEELAGALAAEVREREQPGEVTRVLREIGKQVSRDLAALEAMRRTPLSQLQIIARDIEQGEA